MIQDERVETITYGLNEAIIPEDVKQEYFRQKDIIDHLDLHDKDIYEAYEDYGKKELNALQRLFD